MEVYLSTVSNAFLMSIAIKDTAVVSFSSSKHVILSSKCIRPICVEEFGKKPNWFWDIFWWKRKEIFSKRRVSKTFEIIGSSEMGRSF